MNGNIRALKTEKRGDVAEAMLDAANVAIADEREGGELAGYVTLSFYADGRTRADGWNTDKTGVNHYTLPTIAQEMVRELVYSGSREA